VTADRPLSKPRTPVYRSRTLRSGRDKKNPTILLECGVLLLWTVQSLPACSPGKKHKKGYRFDDAGRDQIVVMCCCHIRGSCCKEWTMSTA